MKKQFKIQYKRVLLISIIALTLAVTSIAAKELEISAELSSDTFAIGQAVQLTVTVNGAKHAEVIMPEVEGLDINYRGSRKLGRNINGKETLLFSSIYVIYATASGKYTIPPIKVYVKGKQVSTTPLSLNVIDSPVKPNRRITGNDSRRQKDLAFIQCTPEKDSAYVGELVPVEIKAYFRVPSQLSSLPVMEKTGVMLTPLNDQPRQKAEIIDGTKYETVTWYSSLSGVKEGDFTIGLSLEATLLIKQARSQDPFFGRNPLHSSIVEDLFLNDFQRRPIIISTKPFTFHVKSLPETGRPEHFSGAIGTFSITAETLNHTVDVGEPVTLKIGISGKGNFDRVQCPIFPDNDNFKTYQPSSDFDIANQIKVFERAVVPKNSNITEIPAHHFTYFDPDKNQYVTIKSEALPLKVNAVQQQSVQPVATPVTVQQPAPKTAETTKPSLHNLVPQKLEPGTVASSLKPVFKQLWFMTVLLVCVVIIITVTIVHWRRKIFDKDLAKQKRKNGNALLQKNRKRILLAQENNMDVITVCRAAIQSQAGHIMNMEPAAITLKNLKNNKKISERLVSLFEFTEQSVYGGAPLSDEQLKDFIDQTIQELEGLK